MSISRIKALTRTAAWSAPAAACVFVGTLLWHGLGAGGADPGSRLVEYSLLLCLFPVGVSGVLCIGLALRWLALAVWPGRLGILADDDGLELRLGPFGASRLPADDLDVKYPFELEWVLVEGSVEALLPKERQRATLLPRITCPGSAEPVNITILRFIGMTETGAAAALRPWVEAWQARHSASDDVEGAP